MTERRVLPSDDERVRKFLRPFHGDDYRDIRVRECQRCGHLEFESSRPGPEFVVTVVDHIGSSSDWIARGAHASCRSCAEVLARAPELVVWISNALVMVEERVRRVIEEKGKP